MEFKHIDLENFERIFDDILKTKKGKNLVKGRFDIESVNLELKSNFIIKFLFSTKSIVGLTYRVLFWEGDQILMDFFESNLQDVNYRVASSYGGGQEPGVIYFEDKAVDENFLDVLLKNHFNYEMAVEPSLNIRVQICVNQENSYFLIDIYDDRGYDVYYLIR